MKIVHAYTPEIIAAGLQNLCFSKRVKKFIDVPFPKRLLMDIFRSDQPPVHTTRPVHVSRVSIFSSLYTLSHCLSVLDGERPNMSRNAIQWSFLERSFYDILANLGQRFDEAMRSLVGLRQAL